MKVVPESHKKEIQHNFQMGTRDYDTLVGNIRHFSQEAWHQGTGVDDMQLDALGKEQAANDWQDWCD